MNWSFLVPLLIGTVLTLVTTLATQRAAESRAVARENRGREHEREVWARDLRLRAHTSFLAEFDERWSEWMEFQDGESEGRTPPPDLVAPVSAAFGALRLVCDDGTARSGLDALETLSAFATRSATWDHVRSARADYFAAMREELGLRPIPRLDDN